MRKLFFLLLLICTQACNQMPDNSPHFTNEVTKILESYMDKNPIDSLGVYLVFAKRDSVGNTELVLAKSKSKIYLCDNMPSVIIKIKKEYIFVYNGMENLSSRTARENSLFQDVINKKTCSDCASNYIEKYKWKVYKCDRGVVVDTSWSKLPQIPRIAEQPPMPSIKKF